MSQSIVNKVTIFCRTSSTSAYSFSQYIVKEVLPIYRITLYIFNQLCFEPLVVKDDSFNWTSEILSNRSQIVKNSK